MIGLGDITNAKLKVGDIDVLAAYVGDIKVYPNEEPTPVVDYSTMYLTFESVGINTLTLTDNGSNVFQYSADNGSNWVNITANQGYNIYDGQKIIIKGNNPTISSSDGIGDFQFKVSLDSTYAVNQVNVYGNIMSLIYGDNFIGQTTAQANMFRGLFFMSSSNVGVLSVGVTDASNLILPTTLANSCFRSMFANNTALIATPVLPATTLAYECYYAMFQNCTSLTSAPVLSATTLAQYCYNSMFQGCTSLTTAPELPATTLASSCYSNMFSNCSSLNYIKAMFTTTPSQSYTRYWVSGVASSGTFVKNSAATWTTTGINGVPNGWTVQTASA